MKGSMGGDFPPDESGGEGAKRPEPGADRLEEAAELIATLVRSTVRMRLLKTIREEQTVRKRELQQQFDCDRTTLSRNLATLEDLNLIKEGPQKSYHATAYGEFIDDAQSAVMKRVSIAQRFEAFLSWLEASEIDIDLGHLRRAELVVADENDPYAPVNRHIEELEHTALFRAVMPVIGRDAMLAGLESLAGPGQKEFEVVVSAGAGEALRTTEVYADLLDELRTFEEFSLYVFPDELPFFLGIYDNVVQLGVMDESGMPRANVTCTSDGLRDWAVDTYLDYREQAHQVV